MGRDRALSRPPTTSGAETKSRQAMPLPDSKRSITSTITMASARNSSPRPHTSESLTQLARKECRDFRPYRGHSRFAQHMAFAWHEFRFHVSAALTQHAQERLRVFLHRHAFVFQAMHHQDRRHFADALLL